MWNQALGSPLETGGRGIKRWEEAAKSGTSPGEFGRGGVEGGSGMIDTHVGHGGTRRSGTKH